MNDAPPPISGLKEERHSLVGPGRAWQMKRAFQARFLKSVGLQPHHLLLDVGCGTLRGGIPLIEYLERGHYYGIEVRDYVLDEGRKELVEENLVHKDPVLILFREFSELALAVRFDFVWAFSVLIHMSDDIAEQFLHFARHHLAPQGRLYANISTSAVPDGQWRQFPLIHRSVPFYQLMGARYGFRVTDLGTLLSLGHVTGVASHDVELRMLVFDLEGRGV